MRILKSALFILLFIACLPLAAQTPAYDELEFEPDSLPGAYKPSGKNYVLIKSKRGEGGMNKTAQADAILTAEVTEIVLVFSETDPGDLAEREEANQERWENLLKTYPELFQFSTTYKSFCQCKIGGDAEGFKQSQGFYVYINGEVPKVAAETPKAEAPKAEAPKPAAPKVEEKKPAAAETPKVAAEKKVETPKTEAPKTEEVKQVAVSDKTAVKTPEPPPTVKEEIKEPVKEKVKEPAKEPVAETESEEKPAVKEAVAAKPKAQKKPAVAKARRTKDPKACRTACYEGGDESLDNFFKESIKLTKKEKRKVKKSIATLKIQLNVDGSIKKSMVTGTDEKFNVMIQGAVNTMNAWNPTVKSGVTVKSEVKIILKYDKATKSIKPFEVAVTPKLAPKCKCASDSELFGD